MKYSVAWLWGLLSLTLVVGCKPGIPSEYLSPGEMENILYDYHIARAMNSNDYQNGDTLTTHVYKLAVLKKYGVSEADYDSSLVYSLASRVASTSIRSRLLPTRHSSLAIVWYWDSTRNSSIRTVCVMR